MYCHTNAINIVKTYVPQYLKMNRKMCTKYLLIEQALIVSCLPITLYWCCRAMRAIFVVSNWLFSCPAFLDNFPDSLFTLKKLSSQRCSSNWSSDFVPLFPCLKRLCWLTKARTIISRYKRGRNLRKWTNSTLRLLNERFWRVYYKKKIWNSFWITRFTIINAVDL